MASRLSLHEELCKVLGNENVYYQPPESVKLSYPCIVYNLSDIYTESADGINYKKTNRYTLTLIHKNPDNEEKDTIIDIFEYCRFDRSFTSDNLNHYVYTLYY